MYLSIWLFEELRAFKFWWLASSRHTDNEMGEWGFNA